jgi:hypothetical protein
MTGFKKITVVLTMAIAFMAMAGVAGAQGAQKGHETVFDQYPSSLGFCVGSPEIVGLTWKHWFGRTGLEVTAGGTYDPVATYSDIYFYSVTAGLSHRLLAEDFASWFSGGLSLIGFIGHTGRSGYQYQEGEGGGQGTYAPSGYKPAFFAAAGIGIESVLFKHFSQELDFVYVAQFLNNPGVFFGIVMSYRYLF